MSMVINGTSGITFPDGSLQGIGVGRRNLIINGAMQVAQRGTSFTGLTSTQYCLDRWQWAINTEDTSTVSQSTDAPSGFGNSFKVEVTTADSSLDATDYAGITTSLEGQDLQSFGWGTASAKDVTISFWCKSSVTGTYASGIYSYGSSEWCTGTFTVDSANTWEYKTITIPAETTSTLPNSNAAGIEFYVRLAAGSSYSSGTPLTWGDSSHLGAGISNNFITTANATFYLTGVQLEVGSVATPFEHRSYGEELALCQRYYQSRLGRATAYVRHDGTAHAFIYLPTSMRTAVPSGSITSWGVFSNFQSLIASGPSSFVIANESRCHQGFLFVEFSLSSYSSHSWIPSWEGFNFSIDSEL